MILVVLVILSILGGGIVLLLQSRYLDASGYDLQERNAMPSELAQGKLLLSEQTFRIEQPARLVAKVDQVFLSPAGQVILMETKTRYRHKAYLYDILELSIQALVLRYSDRKPLQQQSIAEYAYVRVVAPDRRPVFLKVKLLTEAAVIAWYRRYHLIISRREEPRPATDPKSCLKCPHRTGCDKRLGT